VGVGDGGGVLTYSCVLCQLESREGKKNHYFTQSIFAVIFVHSHARLVSMLIIVRHFFLQPVIPPSAVFLAGGARVVLAGSGGRHWQNHWHLILHSGWHNSGKLQAKSPVSPTRISLRPTWVVKKTDSESERRLLITDEVK
jgi:hypothetical protein